jgi:hypothetical protein
MYLLSMNSLLELIRFLNTHYDWVVLLRLKRNVRGSPKYIVPNRTAFNHFVNRLGPDRIVEILAVMVCRLMKMGVIKGEKVSLDCKIIWAYFKPCTFGNKHDHRGKAGKCRKNKSKDKDAPGSGIITGISTSSVSKYTLQSTIFQVFQSCSL